MTGWRFAASELLGVPAFPRSLRSGFPAFAAFRLSRVRCVPAFLRSGFRCVPAFAAFRLSLRSGFRCVPAFAAFRLSLRSGFRCVPAFAGFRGRGVSASRRLGGATEICDRRAGQSRNAQWRIELPIRTIPWVSSHEDD
jgi:hypothetical protein